MTEYEKWNLFIKAVSVLATLGVILVAVFGERIKQVWTRPKLKIRLDPPSLTATSDGHQGWFYLLHITNEKNSSPAKNVRVLLTKIYKRGPDGLWREQRFSGPTQVSWRWSQVMPLYVTVGPDEWSTFGRLLDNSDSFDLQLYWYPNNLDRYIRPNDPTRLEFKAVSDTAQSNALTVEIAWDGKWVEGNTEMQRHLISTEV